MRIYRQLILGLLTFLLIISVLPVTAGLNSKLNGQYASSLNGTAVATTGGKYATHRLGNPRTRLAPEETPKSAALSKLKIQNSKSTTNSELRTVSSPTVLLEQGKQLYDAGQLTEAIQFWEQAVKASTQRKDQHTLALSYNYLAIGYQDLGQWQASQKAIAQVFHLLRSTDDPFLYAQALNTQGSLQLNTGRGEVALETWKQAEVHYRSLKDTTGIVLVQINQAQALQTLGLYRRSRTKLEQIRQDLRSLASSLVKAQGLRSLGVTLQVVGDLQQSQTVLLESLAIAKQLNSTSDIGETLFRLGNTARAMADFEAALKFYRQATDTATSPSTQLEAQLNQLSLLVRLERWEPILILLPQIKTHLASLPPSRATVYAQVNLAESLMKLGVRDWGLGTREEYTTAPLPLASSPSAVAQILATSVRQARELRDPRAESYALGQLGHLYEQSQQWSEARSLTQQALALAQEIQAADVAVNWQWQQGRILKAQGDINSAVSEAMPEAIAAYDEALKTLASLRQDLVAIDPNVQFSFREQVEPVYRQFVQLLLQNVDSLPEPTKQQHLQRSREAIEALQLAELENFFREACLVYKFRPIEAIDSKAAVIYPILLDQRLEVILSLPGQPLQHYGTNLAVAEGARVEEELRQSLNPAFLPAEVLPPAQQIYDWLLRPARAELERQGIKTLVFVLDGFLRSLPMAVLHDGKQYLVERYNIALTPGLQLLESRTLSPNRLSALVGGVAQSRQGFSALPGVETEIEQIASRMEAQVLLNKDFTRSNFQQRIEALPFSVVHLATHGEFSSEAKDTFILAWDNRINVKDLERLLRGQGESATLRDRQPIELLVLSACQTAKGDNRAALGLAGIAVRSGARSTLATLWSVQDRSTAQLVADFYRNLTQASATKAEALRQAQLSLLHSSQYNHPYYWSPFVLLGNWR